ncbi:hypothetical protein [Rhizobium mesoamericanum]|uniref:Uncharacterized protein n=1 Tax=Rhizobium mesoamericanum STM3625 TaxID=1211777 RepID=K0PZY6_9HYPH|nr:hypothetical protein [Rhizobium mesoamericanum]CCM77122.1 conserved hypothetical protein [Rhizobium mesoamericanum STM3625]
MAVEYLSAGSPDGTVMGRSSTDKIGFFNATPSVRASGFTAPAGTAATNSTPYGYSQAQADAIVTWIRAVDAELKAKGLIA